MSVYIMLIVTCMSIYLCFKFVIYSNTDTYKNMSVMLQSSDSTEILTRLLLDAYNEEVFFII